MRHTRALTHAAFFALASLIVLCGVAHPAPAAGRPPDLLGMVHANNRTEHVAFEIDPRQRHVSELRIRSGSLGLHVFVVEITFADGSTLRVSPDEILAPGHASRPVRVDARRAVAEVAVSMRPGPRPGQTVIQLLGTVEKHPPVRALPGAR